jgi:hypothetical protein
VLSVMKVLSPSTTCSAHGFEKREPAIRSVWCPYTEALGWQFVVAAFLCLSSLDRFLLEAIGSREARVSLLELTLFSILERARTCSRTFKLEARTCSVSRCIAALGM